MGANIFGAVILYPSNTELEAAQALLQAIAEGRGTDALQARYSAPEAAALRSAVDEVAPWGIEAVGHPSAGDLRFGVHDLTVELSSEGGYPYELLVPFLEQGARALSAHVFSSATGEEAQFRSLKGKPVGRTALIKAAGKLSPAFAFHLAALEDDKALRKAAVDRGFEPRQGRGSESLAEAAQGQDVALVRTLLRAGADPNARDSDGLPVAWSAWHAPILEAFVKAGASLAGEHDGATVWQHIIASQLEDDRAPHKLVEIALAGGADPNAGTPPGCLAVLVGLRYRKSDVVKRVLETLERAGARFDAQSKRGGNARFHAGPNPASHQFLDRLGIAPRVQAPAGTYTGDFAKDAEVALQNADGDKLTAVINSPKLTPKQASLLVSLLAAQTEFGPDRAFRQHHLDVLEAKRSDVPRSQELLARGKRARMALRRLWAMGFRRCYGDRCWADSDADYFRMVSKGKRYLRVETLKAGTFRCSVVGAHHGLELQLEES